MQHALLYLKRCFLPGHVRVPLELTANVATPFPGNVTLLRKNYISSPY